MSSLTLAQELGAKRPQEHGVVFEQVHSTKVHLHTRRHVRYNVNTTDHQLRVLGERICLLCRFA